MALSRSMMEQEKKEKKEVEAQLAAPTLGLQWRSDRGELIHPDVPVDASLSVGCILSPLFNFTVMFSSAAT